jgi:PAS domain S-box-containing protein
LLVESLPDKNEILMKTKILDFIDFEKVNLLLEGFNKSTGFVTAILDLEGNVLSKSGWRQVCTEFHRSNPETAGKCTISDTVLANKMSDGEKYHFYKCLNGLVDVAVPVLINGEHVANLFSGQFFFEEADISFFKKQARKYGFEESSYLKAIGKVPVISKEKVKTAMDFLLNMTQLISELTYQKLEQAELNNAVQKSEQILKLFVENSPASIAMFDNQMRYMVVSRRFMSDYNLGKKEVINLSHYEVFPEISGRWKEIHRRGLAGETISADKDPFPRADGTIDFVRWEIRPWYESDDQIGGIILFSEVITDQVRSQEQLLESERHLRNSQNIAHLGSWRLDIETNEVIWTEELYRMYGFDPSLPPPPYTEHMKLFTPESWQKLSVSLANTRETGTPYELELETVKKDSTNGWMWVRGEALKDTEGKIIALWGAAQDITDRKRTEIELARLLESEQTALMEANKAKEQLSQILDRISDGFGSLDRDWTYTFVNEQLAKNVGKKREDLLGRNIWEVFPEAIGTPVHKAYFRAMEEQVAIDLEHYYSPFRRWFQHQFYPAPDGLSVFSKDITENKLAEEKIKENSSLVRIAAEKAKLGGWNVDLKENRSYWSDEVAAIHEMPAGYVPLVEDGINFYAPEWRDRIIKVFSDCANNGIPYDEEMEIITSSGKRVWIRTIGEAVRDDNGNIYKVEGAFQDISEKKIAEAKVREKDLQFRKLSANVPDLIFQFTRRPDGTYCVPVASEGIKNIFGCSPEDVVNDFTPISNVLYPEDAERVVVDIEYSAKHLTYFICEFRVLIPGMPVQWILSRSTPEKLPDGSITWYGFNANITNRKEVEEALRESEEKYRYMFVNNPQPMWIYDLETLFFLEVNDAAVKHYGYSREEFLKMTLKDIRPPEDVEALLKDVQLTRKTLNPAGEWRHLKKNGELINVEIISHSVSFNNRKARHVMITDITERKRTEEQLRKSETRFQLMFDHATFGIVICQLIRDKSGKAVNYLYLQANESITRHVGIKPIDVLDKKGSEVISGEELEILVEKFKTVVESGIPFEYQQFFSTFNRTIDIQIIHIVDDYFSVVFFDITEKKQSEYKINKLNERLELLIDVIKDLSIASDLEAIMKIVKRSVRKLVNADGSTFVLLDGDSCYYADEDTISPLWKGQRFPLNSCISGWAMLNKQSVKIEDIYSDPRIPVEAYRTTFVKSLAMVPIRISDPLGAIGAYWSIKSVPSETDIQLLQTLADATARAVENIQFTEGLENMVNIRTSQLEAANKELEAFSYSVSHDLRAPLRHINGFAEIITKQYSDQLPEEAKKHLNTITGSAKKMGTLIDDLLSFSRTSRAEMKKSTLKMNQVIEDALAQIKPSFKDRKITWKILPLPDVHGDYNLLRMAWINLLDNAVKYTKHKEKAVIQIGYKEEKREIVFYIKDNGVGFDMKYADKLFDVFQRLHSSAQFDGTGIGLANVQRIILRHGGRIWAEAETDKGAAFYFSIPNKQEAKL